MNVVIHQHFAAGTPWLMNQMNIVVDTEDFKVSYQPGSCSIAVVAFTGVGYGLGAVQTEEFRKSLTSFGESGGTLPIVFVIDKRRRWYNDGIIDGISQSLDCLLKSLGSETSVFIGNSMGGFGAIVFAKRVKTCRRVIAFSPQSSVNPEVVPFEKRWNEWRTDIRNWDVKDALEELSSDVSYHLMFGAEDATDVLHAQRFESLRLSHVHSTIVPGCEHDVARVLKERGLLSDLLRRLIWGLDECPATGPLARVGQA